MNKQLICLFKNCLEQISYVCHLEYEILRLESPYFKYFQPTASRPSCFITDCLDAETNFTN